MRRIPMVLSSIAFMLAMCVGVDAATVYVDASNTVGPWDGTHANPFNKIQDGIDAASQGDMVLVADGTYIGTGNKDLDFGGKAIVVTSENGSGSTIIDCENDGRGFYFHSGEDESSVVNGFTIRNGNATSNDQGGGIYCNASSPTITNCIISGNIASYGGGIYCRSSSPIITDCTISSNTADWNGGGIRCDDSSPTITNCTISDNTVRKSIGIGGGILCIWSSPAITNCTISGNTANEGGGGIYCNSSSPTITNCTVSGNTTNGDGGGIFSYLNSPRPKITNSIFWANSPNEIVDGVGGSTTATYSDIQGGWTGTGNINADPLFVGGGDYHLSDSSPCIGAGIGAVGIPDTDMDGNPRPTPPGSNPDMGAYEHVLGSTTQEFQLTVSTDPSGLVDIPGAGFYEQETEVQLEAPSTVIKEDVVYGFVQWTVDETPIVGNPITIPMDADHVALSEYNGIPVADAGPDQTLDCVVVSAEVALDGSGSSDPDPDDELTYSWSGPFGTVSGVSPMVTLGGGSHTITLTVDDGQATDTDQVVIAVNLDVTPPVITLNGEATITLECCVDEYVEPGATAADACDDGVAATPSGEVLACTPGVYSITYTATDAAGNVATATRTVNVVDTTPPEVTVGQTVTTLWPPNHKMHLVATVAASDICGEAGDRLSLGIVVTSNQDINGLGDGNTDADWEIVDNGNGTYEVWLRAERSGKEGERIYTITSTASDGYNETVVVAEVTVAHDQGKKGKLAVALPEAYALAQNVPNPFNSSTQIAYQLPEEGYVELTIHNLLGQPIRTLVQAHQDAGTYQVTWDGRDDYGQKVSNGVYLYRFVSQGLTQTRQMLLLK